MAKRRFAGIDKLPRGKSRGKVTECCLVLEGGAFRGLYEEGVLDALLLEDINASCVIGVSAGALNGLNYVAGQIGRAARVNLGYRFDSRYIGGKAFRRNRGIVGFDFLFRQLEELDPLDRQRFFRRDQRFVAVATDCRTGKTEYFEKGKCRNIFKAIKASASLPFVSKMVMIDGTPYLDGGCSCKIAYQWAIDQGYEKIIVIRTRPASYRNLRHRSTARMAKAFYHSYPKFAAALADSDAAYNRQCDELERLQKEGRIYMISPYVSVHVSRLERDLNKLGAWYYCGYEDTCRQMGKIRKYLGIGGIGDERKKTHSRRG